jgi:hypothetical protein
MSDEGWMDGIKVSVTPQIGSGERHRKFGTVPEAAAFLAGERGKQWTVILTRQRDDRQAVLGVAASTAQETMDKMKKAWLLSGSGQ